MVVFNVCIEAETGRKVAPTISRYIRRIYYPPSLALGSRCAPPEFTRSRRANFSIRGRRSLSSARRGRRATIATLLPFPAPYLFLAHNREERENERESACSHRARRLFHGSLDGEARREAVMGFDRFDRFGERAPAFPAAARSKESLAATSLLHPSLPRPRQSPPPPPAVLHSVKSARSRRVPRVAPSNRRTGDLWSLQLRVCAGVCALCASTRAQSAGGARAVSRIAKREPATRPPPTHPRESEDLLPDIEKVPFSRHYARRRAVHAASAADTVSRQLPPRSLRARSSCVSSLSLPPAQTSIDVLALIRPLVASMTHVDAGFKRQSARGICPSGFEVARGKNWSQREKVGASRASRHAAVTYVRSLRPSKGTVVYNPRD